MIFREERMDLFDVGEEYYLAHCISADYKLGAGIAVEFNRRFDLRKELLSVGDNVYPDCIQINRVFNLVTKEKYWYKPTYDSLRASLELMRDKLDKEESIKIAMPVIGCGLDRLKWDKVKDIILDVFDGANVEILVCVV